MCEDLCITCIMKEHERDIHQQFCTRAYKTSVLIMAFERTHILYAQKGTLLQQDNFRHAGHFHCIIL